MPETISSKKSYLKIVPHESVRKMRDTIQNCERSYRSIAEDLQNLVKGLDALRELSLQVTKFGEKTSVLVSSKGQQEYNELISNYQKLHAELGTSAKMSLRLLKLHASQNYPKIFQQHCKELGFDD